MDVLCILSEAEMAERLAACGRASRPRPPYALLFPAGLVDRATDHLRANGKQGLEQLVLWGGYTTPRGVVIASLLMPDTEATWGWVHILPPEQPRIAEWLHGRGQRLYVESHTHGRGPWATEISDEDRRHPAGRQEGFLTVIVPAYAEDGIRLPEAGVWECRQLAWYRMPDAEVAARLSVVSDKEARRALA